MIRQRLGLTWTSTMLLAVCLVAGVADAQAANGEEARQHFERTDTDKNGMVSREEYRSRMVEVFFSIDQNRDGGLQRQELQVADSDFASVDTSGDQLINLAEFLNRRMADFTLADKNRNGTLEFEEVLETYPN